MRRTRKTVISYSKTKGGGKEEGKRTPNIWKTIRGGGGRSKKKTIKDPEKAKTPSIRRANEDRRGLALHELKKTGNS